MNTAFERFTASLHTHVRSLHDAFIPAKALCERIIALGGQGCAITDHRTLSSIEDYRRVFADYGLKLIPGCELDIDGGILGGLHLIVLAADDLGYKAIIKMVTEANKTLEKGRPLLSEDQLFAIMADYKGHVFATSACMRGVIPAIRLMNAEVEEKVNRLKQKASKYAQASLELKSYGELLQVAEESLKSAMADRDALKKASEKSLLKEQRIIAKMKEKGEDATALEAELAKKLSEKEAAAEKLTEAKRLVETAKKELSFARKTYKEASQAAATYHKYEAEIEALEKEYQPEETLFAMAVEKAAKYQEVFGRNRFFIELQYHGIPEEEKCFPFAVRVGKELSIPFVASNDVHILTNSEDDILRRQVLRSCRFDRWEEGSQTDKELYLKDNYELQESLEKILPESVVHNAIRNIKWIFDRCNVSFETGKHYPKFRKEEGYDANATLDEMVEKGIAWRFPNGMDTAHQERLTAELQVIKDMGYADYHLIVKDFLEYGRLLGYVPEDRLTEAPLTIEELKAFIAENGWTNPGFTIGPGRGSAGGSLVCYLLKITSLDPIVYSLLFERFLNPERVSMPDIDSDIAGGARQKVIEYVKNRYGEDAVCGIMTLTHLAPKGALRLASRFYGLRTYGEKMTTLGDKIAKEVPNAPGVSFQTDVEGKPLREVLLAKYTSKDAQEIIRWATVLEGSFTAYGAHAAGVVISDNTDLSEYMPLQANTELGMMTSQCDMVQVEEMGLLKFDFLGLITLDVITETLRLIQAKTGTVIDPLALDLRDANVYQQIFSAGKTKSVFQFESEGMRSMLRQFRPETFEDLIILVSMFRPGPLQYLDDVIQVKNGKKEMTFLCDELKPILGKTYGAIVYQEQVMEICQKLAGFTLGHADEVRRYMSKKKAEKLAHEREAFVAGCSERGIAKEIAETLFSQMEEFAKYAFNKSHAASYAYNAYITAWLKCYYPVEFFTAALNHADSKKIPGLMYEAKTLGIEILVPDINKSALEFSVDESSIRFGLAAIKGVKNNAQAIITERSNGEYKSLKDFAVRTAVSKSLMAKLVDAGALDAFSENRSALRKYSESLLPLVNKYQAQENFVKCAKLVLPMEGQSEEAVVKVQEEAGLKPMIREVREASLLTNLAKAEAAMATIEAEIDRLQMTPSEEDLPERMAKEKELLGSYVSNHPMDFYPEKDITVIADLPSGKGKAYGVITNLVMKNRKSDGKPMAFFDLEDQSGSIKCCAFTDAYATYSDMIKEGTVVSVFGTVQAEEYEAANGEVEVEKKLICNDFEAAEPEKSYFESRCIMREFERVRATVEKTYGDPNGHRFFILDPSTGKRTDSGFRVRTDAKGSLRAEEILNIARYAVL